MENFDLLTRNQLFLVLVCFAIWGHCSHRKTHLRNSVAVQWNDFKIFFVLCSSFQHMKFFIGKLWQPSKLLDF